MESFFTRRRGGAILFIFFCFFAKSLSAEALAYRDARIPYPAELRFKVEFWKAIYTKYTTRQGILHDAEDLSLIYDAVELPKNGDFYAVDQMRARIRENLFNILRKHGDNLTVEERLLLAKFPRGATRSRLLQATENIRFQLGQADRFKQGVIRSGYYMKHIEKILKEEGIPDFMKYLPHVESSFQEFAISKFGAAGLWQLMESTGKQYLRVEYSIDERLDPWMATRAAARHLKRDFQILGAWPLAVTAYNHGAGGVQRAMKALGTTDIADISFRYQSPSFGFASRNFYCQFLAAVEVASNYEKYLGPLDIPKPIEFDEVTLKEATYLQDFGRTYRYTMDEFKRLNPALRPPVLMNRRPIPRGVTIRIPLKAKNPPMLMASKSKSLAMVQNPAAAMDSEAEIGIMSGVAGKSSNRMAQKFKPPIDADLTKRFLVQDVAAKRGWISVEMNETIAQISDWLKVTPQDLRNWNGMESDGQARLGQKLLLRFDTSTPQEFQTARTDYHKQIREDFFSQYVVADMKNYVVQRGENLWSICFQKFEIPPWLLAEYNPKAALASLAPGTPIKIPVLREKTESELVGETP